MKIRIKSLLKLFEEKENDNVKNGQDLSSLNILFGEELVLAIFKDYCESLSGKVSILNESCNTGRRNGPRLDAWIEVKKSKRKKLYQVEVKNWGAYSYGGKYLPINASQKELKLYAKKKWQQHLGNKKLDPRIGKVKEKMQMPDGYAGTNPIPLLCFWFYITNEVGNPYSVDEKHGIHIFSTSAYLRTLKAQFIKISLPKTEKRLKLFEKLK